VLPSNSSVNSSQHATLEEAVISLVLTDVPVDWVVSDYMMCFYCRSMSVPSLYK
jgi:hypothetical protein